MTRENQYLFRLPLLDHQQNVIGYKLACQKNSQDRGSSDANGSQQLLAFLAEHAGEIKSSRFFLDVSPDALGAPELQTIAPEAAVLILKQGDLIDAGHMALASSLSERGFALALRDVDFASLKANELLLSSLTYVWLSHGHPDLTEIADFAKRRQPPLFLVVENIPGWPQFDASIRIGSYGILENLCTAPRETVPPARLGPQAQQILQLMHMVQGDADIRNVEQVLKSDVALSYKLLRYINSAGFGLELEIDSPRHAVAMLGYAPMFRWLLLLLVRTNTEAFSPALMQAAMVRGRFAELLGQGFLSKREAENLFVVGMFSFLDHMLGISLQEMLRQLNLPEAVSLALLSREGVYGPVLALVEASEQEHGRAADFAEALSMTTDHVNQSHLSALAWAKNIKL